MVLPGDHDPRDNGDDRARERAVVGALQGHGLGRATASAVWLLGCILQERTRQRGVEFAALVDAETGSVTGAIKRGSPSGVDMQEPLSRLRTGHRYVALHTHPASSSFSDADAVLLVTHDALSLIVVIGLDGTWYLLGRSGGGQPADATRLVDVFRATALRLGPRYLALAQSGALTRPAALSALLHGIWRQIAPPLGLRYDRV